MKSSTFELDLRLVDFRNISLTMEKLDSYKS